MGTQRKDSLWQTYPMPDRSGMAQRGTRAVARRQRQGRALRESLTIRPRPASLPAVMKPRPPTTSPAQARRWAARLTARMENVLSAHPMADPDNIRHTLILLEQPPLERLQRSLIRGRAAALRGK